MTTRSVLFLKVVYYGQKVLFVLLISSLFAMVLSFGFALLALLSLWFFIGVWQLFSGVIAAVLTKASIYQKYLQLAGFYIILSVISIQLFPVFLRIILLVLSIPIAGWYYSISKNMMLDGIKNHSILQEDRDDLLDSHLI